MQSSEICLQVGVRGRKKKGQDNKARWTRKGGERNVVYNISRTKE